ncbi:EGF-like domain-containing protein comC [Ostrea edulis]|uniref:EGF-like domain-containing protein comC n=1 Tax=Ostrea edulis TaxID=37623 RepID=UPI0024AF9FE3|nr:EGF-like domain-containing protein comC [Ostrea edulis]
MSIHEAVDGTGSTDINTSVYMTEEEAITSCTEFMDQSPSFKVCKDVPNVDPNIAINTCVLDILLTNSTQWMIDAREGIKGKCLAEVRVNATLQNETESGGASIAEIVKNISCINDCLGKGKCQNGSCVCEMGFGGGDCGIDLSIPPIIYGIVDSGLCDLELLSCTSANLEGDGFTSEGNPTCRMRTFHLLKSY